MYFLYEAFIDSVKLLPLLFIFYFIIEYIEHKKNSSVNHILMNSKKAGPIIGALFGCIPQCGFSVVAANLYSSRVITLGTIVAVFVSTSDEAIPILLSNPEFSIDIFKVLIIKFFIACFSGFMIDFFVRTKINNNNICHDEKEHKHYHGNCESCDDGILKAAIIHSVKIFIFILIVNIIFGYIIERVGEDMLSSYLMTNTVIQPFICSLIGLIPNCAASVILTQMYIDGGISFGALVGGLCTGAGVGMMVLFKENSSVKNSIMVISIVYIIGVVFGILIQTLM